ncbi:hypothetical protein IWX90DRAFT_77401 [Phyllosticta citrichinensis]|uniref:Secreted protein n=1 Tax=Phyllosticta citrichinensis TaxID=1130410 RepID=A0ABR1XGR7_9PEZI
MFSSLFLFLLSALLLFVLVLTLVHVPSFIRTLGDKRGGRGGSSGDAVHLDTAARTHSPIGKPLLSRAAGRREMARVRSSGKARQGKARQGKARRHGLGILSASACLCLCLCDGSTYFSTSLPT